MIYKDVIGKKVLIIFFWYISMLSYEKSVYKISKMRTPIIF